LGQSAALRQRARPRRLQAWLADDRFDSIDGLDHPDKVSTLTQRW